MESKITFVNCFEIENQKNVTLIIITAIKKVHGKKINFNDSSKLKLEAVILSNSKYLDSVWRANKSYSKNYKKINVN